MTDCHCPEWDEGRVLVILETGHDPGPAHAQPSWIIPCHGTPPIAPVCNTRGTQQPHHHQGHGRTDVDP